MPTLYGTGKCIWNSYWYVWSSIFRFALYGCGVCVCVCLSVRPSVRPSVRLSVSSCLSASLSLRLLVVLCFSSLVPFSWASCSRGSLRGLVPGSCRRQFISPWAHLHWTCMWPPFVFRVYSIGRNTESWAELYQSRGSGSHPSTHMCCQAFFFVSQLAARRSYIQSPKLGCKLCSGDATLWLPVLFGIEVRGQRWCWQVVEVCVWGSVWLKMVVGV